MGIARQEAFDACLMHVAGLSLQHAEMQAFLCSAQGCRNDCIQILRCLCTWRTAAPRPAASGLASFRWRQEAGLEM